MKSAYYLLAVFIVCICLIYGLAQAIPYLPDAPPLPKLNEVYLKADIAGGEDGNFIYSYEITNGRNSMGDLTRFQVDISLPEGGAELPDEGLKDKVEAAVEKAENTSEALPDEGLANTPEYDYIAKYGVLSLKGTKPMVPVTFSPPPPDWLVGLTVRGTASWGGSRLSPGSSMSGFIFQSKGIPVIRDFTAYPIFDTELLKYYPDVDSISDEENDIVEAQLQNDRKEITYYGKTIGPTAPPAELVPADFLQGIIDMKHEAMELGWVTNEGIKDSLDMKLEAALKKFQSGNTKAAANILGAFINEVEAQGCESYADCPKGKHLTPEAYALLKFNAQYLIDNLK